MPYLTNSVILFPFASKNSSQNGQFFKTIPANFGGNKENYLPLKMVDFRLAQLLLAFLTFGPKLFSHTLFVYCSFLALLGAF